MTIMQIKLVRTFAEEFSLNRLQTNLETDEVEFTTFTVASAEASKRFFIGFNLALRVEDKNQFSVKYLAEFECDTDVTPDMLEKHAFVQVNAPAIAYPFMRAFIATILLNAGYEPPMLPAVNFQMLYKQRQDE
ncbi:protein-export chaperone SecB [Aquaspirillum serpens]|uniref:protein-export chaperone SecB n=1 Tax=Aquaspirillum serpens TaxID=190 RepID=UPI0003B39BB4|nr:protein-export chaperone SecB [Aquaspirillum serpens]